MKIFHSLLLVLLTSLFLAGCNDDDPAPGSFNTGSGGGGDTGGDAGGDTGGDGGGEATTTTYDLAVEVPEGVEVAINDDLNPLSWMMQSAVAADVAIEGLDLDNFEVRLFDPDGDGLDGDNDFEVIEDADLVLNDLGNGEYELSVPGQPSVKVVIVTVLTTTGANAGNTLELQVPATRASGDGALRMNYASTAATRQYIAQAVEAGGFDENLDVDEVSSLIDEVAERVASVPLPPDTDLSNPDAVFEALDRAASDLVRAQVRIATSNPEDGTLEAFQGNYYGAFFSRKAFGQNQGLFMETEILYEDYNGITADPLEAALAGVPITVDADQGTATITLANYNEQWFGARYFGSEGSLFEQTYQGQETISDSEEVPADILADGTLIVDPGTGAIDGGYTDQSGNFYAEINNTTSFELMPWGEAYVGSQFFRFDEYRLNDCLASLGLTLDELTGLEEGALEDAITGLPAGSAATIVDDCNHNGVLHEVLGITLAKKLDETDDLHTTADLNGQWGVVGLDTSNNFGRGAFSSVLTFENGAMDESDYLGFSAFESGSELVLEAYSDAVTGASAELSAEGVLKLEWATDEVDAGFVSSDLGLGYIGGMDIEGDGDFLEAEVYSAYLVPLATGITPADLDGKTFEFVGLQLSVELLEGGVAANHDSNAGIRMSFSETSEGGFSVALSGSSDLGQLDYFFDEFGGLTGYDLGIEMNDPASGEFEGTIADNGMISIDFAEEGEHLKLTGFYDANGRLAISITSVSPGTAISDAESGMFPSVNAANFGYLLGTCVAGCAAE